MGTSPDDGRDRARDWGMIQSPLQRLLRIWMTTPTKTTTTTVAAVRDGKSAYRRCGNDCHGHPCPHPHQRHALRHQCGCRVHQHHRVIVSSPCHIVASLSLLSLVLTTFTAAIALASIIAAAIVVAANRQCRRCSPPLMVGCCVAYSVVCRPICHTLLSSSCNRHHFCRRPPAAIPYRRPSLPAAVLSITFTATIDGWLLHSPPTKQHTK